VALDDKQMVEMANNLRGGVPMATPVFDGRRRIGHHWSFWKKLVVNTSGQVL
jgi:DNA-directed RNA polymerase subunit beta